MEKDISTAPKDRIIDLKVDGVWCRGCQWNEYQKGWVRAESGGIRVYVTKFVTHWRNPA